MDDALPRWFVRRADLVLGPYTSARIRRQLNDGEMDPGDEVSRDGVQWQAAADVPEVMPPQLRRSASSDDAAELALRQGLDRRRSLVAVGALSMAVLIAIGATLWLDQGREAPAESRCDAAPAPGVQWRNCRLDGLQAEAADLREMSGLNMSLRGAGLARTLLNRADLRYVDLSGANLSYADLVAANLLGASLRHADLTYADLSGANLEFSDLSGARVGGAVWREARLSGAVWVDGRRCAEGSLGSCD